MKATARMCGVGCAELDTLSGRGRTVRAPKLMPFALSQIAQGMTPKSHSRPYCPAVRWEFGVIVPGHRGERWRHSAAGWLVVRIERHQYALLARTHLVHDQSIVGVRYAKLAGDKPWAGAANINQFTMEMPNSEPLSFQFAGTIFQRPPYFGVATGAIVEVAQDAPDRQQTHERHC